MVDVTEMVAKELNNGHGQTKLKPEIIEGKTDMIKHNKTARCAVPNHVAFVLYAAYILTGDCYSPNSGLTIFTKFLNECIH